MMKSINPKHHIICNLILWYIFKSHNYRKNNDTQNIIMSIYLSIKGIGNTRSVSSINIQYVNRYIFYMLLDTIYLMLALREYKNMSCFA